MDFQDCFAILQARSNNDPQTAAPSSAPLPSVAEPIIANIAANSDMDYTSFNSRVLIQKFNDLQAARIATYRYFDQELGDIIEGNCPARYPLICSEVTQKFSALSASINKIVDALRSRGAKDAAQCIAKIQGLEKDKLMLTAAAHLDELKSTVLAGTERVTGEKTEEQVRYLAGQIAACQASIVEAVEELQCCVCDLEDTEEE